MIRYKKLLRWILYTFGFITAALIIFLAIAPWLINSETVKRTIITEFSKRAGIELKFQDISLFFLPWPHVSIAKGGLAIPEAFTASWNTLSVSPKLLPFLNGNIQISRFSIEEPEIDIVVTGKAAQTDSKRKISPDLIQEKIAPLVGFMAGMGKDLNIIVKNGRIKIPLENKTGMHFSDIDARIDFPADTLNIDFKSKADFCEKITLTARIDPNIIKSRGQIDLFRFRPQNLPANLITAGDIRLGDSLVNLSLKFNADRFDVVQAEVQGTLPMLTVRRLKKQIVVKGRTLKGRILLNNEKIDVSLSEIQLDQPQLTLAGTFFKERATDKMAIDLKGIDVDIPSTRQTALELADDIVEVKKVFDIIKGGRISAIRFTTRTHSNGDLGALENITLSANLLQGEIYIPGVQFSASTVSAEVGIDKGMLSATKITAGYGNIRVCDGSMRLGLAGQKTPFHLDIGLDADLNQVPTLLKKVVDDKRFIDELALIRNISGRGVGRLILGETLDAIHTNVTVSDFSLSAVLPQLPYLLELKGNDFAYSGALITVKKLNGHFKNSDFSLDNIALNWEKTPVIRIRSGKAELNIDEIYAWLAMGKSQANPLKDIKTITGSVKLSQLEMNGPLNSPSNWKYQLAGSAKNILVKTDLLPAPLSVSNAIFKGTQGVLTFNGAKTNMLDTSMTVSGRFNGYREGLHQADLGFQGVVGPKGNQWLIKTIHLPSHFVLQPPMTVANGRFGWDRNGRTAFSGNLAIQNDVNVSADVLLAPDTINIKNCIIKDKVSQAVFTLNYSKKKNISFGFKGSLQKATADKLLADNQNLHGWIKGDLRLEYLKDYPMNSKFEGTLAAEDLLLLQHFNIPVTVNSLSMKGIKDKLHLESDMLFLRDHHLKLKGDVNYSPKGIVFDTDLYSDGILLDNLAMKLGKNKKNANNIQTDTFWNFPVEGIVRLDSAYVSYGKYIWRPLRATVTLHPEKIDLAVSDATLCGVSTPGTVILSPQEVELDFKLATQNQDLSSSTICLLDKTAKTQGVFNLTGEINGRGAPENLVKSLSGNIEFNATKGRIYAGSTFRTLRDIVSLLNITEIYRGSLPELNQDGFSYNSINSKMKIKNNAIVLEEGFIDGLTMGIAGKGVLNLTDKKLKATVLVAPLKTVDTIVKNIPLVGYVLGGNLVSIPFGIKGDLNNPEVTPLPPTAIGEGLLDMMIRTLKLPVKIIEPLLPKN